MPDARERHARLQTVFGEALGHGPTAREAYLDRVCAADPERRTAVARLLAAHDSTESFLEHLARLNTRTFASGFGDES
jgi:hypothetical protein